MRRCAAHAIASSTITDQRIVRKVMPTRVTTCTWHQKVTDVAGNVIDSSNGKGGILTEQQLMEAVLELAAWLRYKAYHTHDSRHSAAGFPDLVLCGRGRVVFVELKSEKGQLTAAQMEWYTQLIANGGDAFVWRPADWLDGSIREELTREGGGHG